MRTHQPHRRAFLGLLVAAAIVAACGGGSGGALGLTQAPASLDPHSPTLAAKDIAFSKQELVVPAGRPFVLVFENQDTVSHNVAIYAEGASTTKVFDGVVFGGPSTRWYPVPALAAGTYVFKCDLHPNMTGTLRAT